MSEPAVTFSRSLYRLDAIEAVAEMYAELAEISISPGESEITVTLARPHPDLAAQIADAFGNHALFETVRRHREAVGGAL